MAFSSDTIWEAWKRVKGKCECIHVNHKNESVRCNAYVDYTKQGMKGKGSWVPHHKIKTKGDDLSNCEILCWDCYSRESSSKE